MKAEDRKPAGAERRQFGAAAVQGAGRAGAKTGTQNPESRVQNPECRIAGGKCPFRRADRERIAWNGKVKGDTIRRSSRQMGDGRQLFAEMPRGAFYVEDRARRRVIFAGEGITGSGEFRNQSSESRNQNCGRRFMVLYREMERGDSTHALRRRGAESRATMSEAMRDLWAWVRGKQGTGMVIVEGEME